MRNSVHVKESIRIDVDMSPPLTNEDTTTTIMIGDDMMMPASGAPAAPGDDLVGMNPNTITTIPRTALGYHQSEPLPSMTSPSPPNLRFAASAGEGRPTARASAGSTPTTTSDLPGAYSVPTRAAGSLPVWFHRSRRNRDHNSSGSSRGGSRGPTTTRSLSRRLSAHLAAPFRSSRSIRSGGSSSFSFRSPNSSPINSNNNQIPPELRPIPSPTNSTSHNESSGRSYQYHQQLSSPQEEEHDDYEQEDLAEAAAPCQSIVPPSLATTSEHNNDKDFEEEGDARIGIAIICGMSLVVIAIILIVYFTVIKQPNIEEPRPQNGAENIDIIKDSSPTLSPTSLQGFNDYNEEDEDVAAESDAFRFQIFNKLVFDILPQYSDDITAFADPTSPQFHALDWLTMNDTINILELDDGSPYGVYANTTTIIQRLVERYVLAVFYFSLDGLEWMDQMSFLSEKHVCNWTSSISTSTPTDGVMCDDNHQIIGLTVVGQNNLRGPIPEELIALAPSMQVIRITHQEVRANLPALTNLNALTRLSNLRILDLSDNRLDSTIPWEIGTLSKLEELSLGQNSLTGTIASAVFQDLSNLRLLHLQNNRLYDDFSHSIHALSSLKDFRVDGNEDLKFNFEDSSLAQLTNLRRLNLAEVDIRDEIPLEVFAGLSNLEILNLKGCGIDMSFPNDSIQQLRSLQDLILDLNFFTGAVRNITSGLANIANLTVLSLRTNEITGSIPDGIYLLSNLIRLDLSNNHLGGTLGSTIGQLSSLEFLSLSQADLSGGIPSTIGNMPNLKSLDLSFNGLNGVIPSELGALIDLESLDLKFNDFSGNIDFLFCSIGDDNVSLVPLDVLDGNPSLICTCCS